MKTASTTFLKEVAKVGITKNTKEKVILTKLHGNTTYSVDISKHIISIGNISEEAEKELNAFLCSDISLTCANSALYDEKVDKWSRSSTGFGIETASKKVQSSGNNLFYNSGNGFFDELTDPIRCEIWVGFDGITDEFKQFDGYVVPASIERKDPLGIEFTCRSWEKTFETINAEEVADKTNTPLKNITGLTLASTASGGLAGAYPLKYFKGSNKLQYDGGTKTTVPGSGSFSVSNKYTDSRKQTLTFTKSGALPSDDAEDTICIIPSADGNILYTGYWFESIHLGTLVGLLFTKAEVTTQDIAVQELVNKNGKKLLTYYNQGSSTSGSRATCYCGNNWFVFAVGNKLYQVKRQELLALTYTEIFDASAPIYKLFYQSGKVWVIAWNTTYSCISIYEFNSPTDSVNLTYVARYNCANLTDATHSWKHISWHPYALQIYMLYNAGGYGYYQYFDMSFKGFSGGIKINKTSSQIADNSGFGVIRKGSNTYFFYWNIRADTFSSFVRYDMNTDSLFTMATQAAAKVDTNMGIFSNNLDWIFSTGNSGKTMYSMECDATSGAKVNYYNTGINSVMWCGKLLYGWNTSNKLIMIDSYGIEVTELDTAIYGDYAGFSSMAYFDDHLWSLYIFGILRPDASHFIAFEYSPRIALYITIADFTDMTVKEALNKLAENFLCIWKLNTKTSGWFYYREFKKGIFDLSSYEENSKIIGEWENKFDRIKINGRDDKEFEAGSYDFNAKELSLNNDFVSEDIGQTLAEMLKNFYVMSRRMFEVKLFLPQLELMDFVKVLHEYNSTDTSPVTVNTLIYKKEYIPEQKTFKFTLLECFLPYSWTVSEGVDETLIADGTPYTELIKELNKKFIGSIKKILV